jgi:hypothetical protein
MVSGMQSRNRLLDALTAAVGCASPEDLRLPANRNKILAILERTPPEDYPAAEWWETAFFLLYAPEA